MALKLLHNEGYKADIAENGEDALHALEKGNYDLILMDIQMPKMGGIEATTEIRKREKNSKRHIPIIALTANTMEGDREQYIAAGMDDYISKPINPKALYEAIRRFTHS